jgi:hypothetical protein
LKKLLKDVGKLAGNFQKRLQRLEAQLAEITKPNPQATCNCRQSTLAASPEHFQAEMNQTCPVHGFRSLGKLNVMQVEIVGKDVLEDRSVGLDELLEEYKRREARYRQEILERINKDDDSAEL